MLTIGKYALSLDYYLSDYFWLVKLPSDQSLFKSLLVLRNKVTGILYTCWNNPLFSVVMYKVLEHVFVIIVSPEITIFTNQII